MDKMNNYLKRRADDHNVDHQFSGKAHFFNVESNGKTHSVSVEVGCDCRYMGVQGVPNGRICSHILAVLHQIYKDGNIQTNVSADRLVQLKRNICMNLVRNSNRNLNEIRYSTSESKKHINKKIEICDNLKKEGKHFITEAIFNNNSRADILVLDTFTVIEIVHSESIGSIINKEKTYPDWLKMEVVFC